jgi:hypothetical protein
MRFRSKESSLASCLLAISLFSLSARGQRELPGWVNAQLPWQKAVVDDNERLLAWYHPEKNQGFDKVMRLAWDFIEHKVPNDTRTGTGLKIYLINSVFDDRTLQGSNYQHNPASVYGQFVDSLLVWYPYSGDSEAIEVVRSMLDYQLAHGTTPADWNWSHVPYATSCDDDREYGRCIRGMLNDFLGGIEVDKLGELGIGYVFFYELSGDRKYLDAGLRCADALARHIRPGDAEHTPWPFRVNAKSGEVINGEEYGGMIVAPVRLFDELIRLKAGDTESYQRASAPLTPPGGGFSPTPWIPEARAGTSGAATSRTCPKNTENVNQASPTMTAYYILTRPDPATVDRSWPNHIGHLLDWVRVKLGHGPYFGAWAIDEQGTPDGRGCCSRAGLASDTSRWGAINALYYEKTGDTQARENAFRSLNYANYFAASDGKISCCGEGFDGQYWFDDGYGDYSRNFSWALGAIPEFAPAGEDHLLRSLSVVQKVVYADRSIQYRTFDPAATEVLRLRFKPRGITAGEVSLRERGNIAADGYTVQTLPGGDFIIRIRHSHSGEIKITA